jgi:hypothetical protein
MAEPQQAEDAAEEFDTEEITVFATDEDAADGGAEEGEAGEPPVDTADSTKFKAAIKERLRHLEADNGNDVYGKDTAGDGGADSGASAEGAAHGQDTTRTEIRQRPFSRWMCETMGASLAT